jgi:hypothetical protein
MGAWDRGVHFNATHYNARSTIAEHERGSMSNAEEDEGVAAKQRRSGPTGSSALLKALIGLSVAGLIYGMFFYRTPIGPPPTVPGWDGLVACSYMGSLDGSKQLVLSEKNTVTYCKLDSG